VEAALNREGFEKYYVDQSELKKAKAGEDDPSGDLIFLHKDKKI
jgi:hypothetical protein